MEDADPTLSTTAQRRTFTVRDVDVMTMDAHEGDFAKGALVFAMFPQTSTFYPGKNRRQSFFFMIIIINFFFKKKSFFSISACITKS